MNILPVYSEELKEGEEEKRLKQIPVKGQEENQQGFGAAVSRAGGSMKDEKKKS